MRKGMVLLGLLLCSIAPAPAQVSVGIATPYVSVGINIPSYPQLVPVPGYPVYYAPTVNANYFFYDGMYWLFDGESWYASTWYNGPWELIAPEFVPLFVLRVPVAYYRRPPVYFKVWGRNSPPHWGEHWGASWERRRSGWDHWDRASVPAPAPLPAYQRQYSGSRYPRLEQQQVLQTQNYRYQPRDAEVRQQYQARTAQVAPPATGSNVIRNPEPVATAPTPPQQTRQATAQHQKPPPSQAAVTTPPPTRTANAGHPTPPSPQASVHRPVTESRQAAVAHAAPSQTVIAHAPPQTNQAAAHPAPPSRPAVAQNPPGVHHPPAAQQHAERPPQVAARAEHPMPKPSQEREDGKGDEGKRQ